jgi:hypothetical protein
MTWAQRLKRVFKIDIETCEQCGGATLIYRESRHSVRASALSERPVLAESASSAK